MAQSLQVLRNVLLYNIILNIILNTTSHHKPKYFQVKDEKHPNKHILVLRRAKHHTLVF